MPDKQVVDSLEYQLVKAKLGEFSNCSEEQIKISRHALERIEFRELDKNMLISCLKDPEKLIKADSQGDDKFKAWFKISGKYSLVAVIRFIKKDNLNIIKIITIYKTSRKWQKQIKPKMRRT